MLKHVKPILVQVHYTLVDRVHSWQLPCHHLRMVELASGAFPRPTKHLHHPQNSSLWGVDISPGESGTSLVFIEGNQNDTNPSHVCTISYKYEHKSRHTFKPFLLHPWIDRLNVSTKPFEGNLRKKNKKTKNNYCVLYRKTNPNKSPTQTKLHSEQCPGPLMEAAQLVSKAHLLMVSAEDFLTRPRTLL